jgi:hypothetical protein
MKSRPAVSPNVPVSWGELIDKLTILEIKSEKIASPEALTNVRHELELLKAIAEPVMAKREISELKAQLKSLNETLWQIEDRVREKEAGGTFDAEFIELARSVYRTNDKRSALKRQINAQLGSAIVEEKSYASY